MFARRRKSSRVWKSKIDRSFSLNRPCQSIVLLDQANQDSSLFSLKSTAKKVTIVSRIENRKLSRDISARQGPNMTAKELIKRPRTSTAGITNMKEVKEAYLKEKQANATIMIQRECIASQADSKMQKCLKEGLLGGYSQYESMSKKQLIEKLISLEYLANKIFRKNKALEGQLKELTEKSIAG